MPCRSSMPRNPRIARALVFVGLGVSTLGAIALAQPSTQTPRPAPVQAVPYEPLVLRVDADRQQWTLNGEILLLGLTRERRDINVDQPVYRTDPFKIEAAVIAYPLPTDTAFTVMDETLTETRLQIGSTQIQESPRTLDGYQSGQRLLVWDVKNVEATSLRLNVQTSMQAFKTVVDEERAFAVDWPKQELPEDLNSSLGPQLYVEADAPEIKRLVERQREASEALLPRETPRGTGHRVVPAV